MSDFTPTKRVRPTQQVQTANDSTFGIYLYSTAVNEVRPIWESGYTVFRALPGLNPDTGYTTFDPLYINEAETGLWVYNTHVVAGAGIDDHRVTFIMRDSFSADDFNLAASPYNVLYKSVKDMESLPVTQRIWSDLLSGRNGRGAALPNCRRPSYFIQCIPYKRGDHTFNAQDALNSLNIIRMTSSAGEALKHTLDKARAEDPSMDITALDQSWFITLWNKKKPHPYTHAAGDERALSYDCCFDKVYRGNDEYQGSSALLTGMGDKIRQLVKPWDQVLRFPSFEEQADWLCYAFDSVPDMIMRAFADNPEWISEKIRRKAGSGSQPQPQNYRPAVAPQQPTPSYPRPKQAGLPDMSAFAPVPQAPWDTGPDVTEDDLPRCAETENWQTHYDNPGDIKY